MTKMGTYRTYPERILQNITSRVLGSVYDSSSAMSMFRLRSWVVSWWFPGVCCCLFAVSKLSWDALCISPSEGLFWAKNSQFNRGLPFFVCFWRSSPLWVDSLITNHFSRHTDDSLTGSKSRRVPFSVSCDQASSGAEWKHKYRDIYGSCFMISVLLILRE